MNNIKQDILKVFDKYSTIEQLMEAYPELKDNFNNELEKCKTFSQEHKLRQLTKILIQKKFFLPLKINIEVTCVCQLKCDFCYIGNGELKKYRSQKFMSYEDFEKIWDDMELFTTEVEFTGGEPIINKAVFKMIKKAAQTGVYSTLTTNAQLITPEIAKEILEANPTRILIALDGVENEMYETTRKKGKFGKLLDNIRLLSKMKEELNSTTNIQLQIIIHKKTVSSVDRFEKLAKELGADSISTKPLFIWPDSTDEEIKFLKENYLIKDNLDLSYYKLDENGEFIIDWREPGYCPNTQNVHIGSGSEVIPCWYLLRDTFKTLRILDSNFYDVWFSDTYKNYRHEMEYGEISPYCKKCIGRYDPKIFSFKNI